MYDFDIMLQKRKEMNSRRRRRKNIDIINDSDDIIAELIQEMKQAADVSDHLCSIFFRFFFLKFHSSITGGF